MDVARLVRYARRRQSYNADVATFVRYFRLVKKLAALGLHIDIFIDTFENMLTEKPQVMAFRLWMPNVMTVGFQHYAALFPLGVCQFTTPEEATIAPHPDVIVCNSPLTARQLNEAGFPAHKLRVGPSLRYRHLADHMIERVPEHNRVLVVLSLDEIATMELLYKLRDAFPHEEDVHIWIKPHPMMSKNRFNALLNKLSTPRYMECVDGRLETWLPRAACAVTTASTSALELALAAVPTIVVGRETDFDLNPLGWFPDLDKPVYTSEELRSRVIEKLSLSPLEKDRLLDWARRKRQECISPLSEDTLAAFVRAQTTENIQA
jgi:surface carbohydrate biosynthesis protein (TIGR04326 family)